MDSAHPQSMRHGKIAGLILEHRSFGRYDAIFCEHPCKGIMGRFGFKISVFHPVDRVKLGRQTARGQDAFGVIVRSIGKDNLAALELANRVF